MCKFEEPELEDGKVTRVQEYKPGFRVCDLDYIGKITVREDYGEKPEIYQAFVIPDSKIFGKDGRPIPLDKLIERIPVGATVDYIFKERIQQKQFKRAKGLLVELKIRG